MERGCEEGAFVRVSSHQPLLHEVGEVMCVCLYLLPEQTRATASARALECVWKRVVGAVRMCSVGGPRSTQGGVNALAH